MLKTSLNLKKQDLWFREFRCHIDAAEQQRALNFALVVSDQLFLVILVAYNEYKIQRPLLLGGVNVTSQ